MKDVAMRASMVTANTDVVVYFIFLAEQ